MIFLRSASTDPAFNLALEEYLFDRMDRSKPYFMLWQNARTIVVGKYQNTVEEINPEAVARHGLRVVRRLSGGGAVYHDLGNLNYTFIVDQEGAEELNFQAFVQPVIRVLAGLGVTARCSGRNDVTIDGLKFSGSAQYAREGRLLHHGCILVDSNLEDVSDALRPRAAKFESKGIKSVRSRVTTISAHTPRPVTPEQFGTLLLREVGKTQPLEPLELTEEQLAEVGRLQREKYASWDWNYGRSPDWGVRLEKKFPSGLLAVNLQVSEGRIEKICFSGDFFGDGEIGALEQALVSLPLGPGLEEMLEGLNVGYYIKGVTGRDLFELLVYG